MTTDTDARLREGWLERQFAIAEREFKRLPKWLQRAMEADMEREMQQPAEKVTRYE